MDIFFSELHNLDTGRIKSLNRCRGAMKAIFLSDITTADGKYLEHFVFEPGTDTAATRYIFPREKPTRTDWAIWIDFWHGYTNTGGKLKAPLGNWINGTHRVWQWYYNAEYNNLQHVKGGRVIHFKPSRGFRLTRSTTNYQRTWDEQYGGSTQLGCPTSVRVILSTRVSKLQEGPSLVNLQNKHTNFWDFICSWRGSWMWEDIDFTQTTTQDLQWIAEGMKNNTLVWTTDGSYVRKKAADLSVVGWIIFCKDSGLQMTGTFWEKSPLASLFRAEMLVLACLHLLARAVAQFFAISHWTAVISCNNKKALELSSHHCWQIRPSAKCADIRRSFRATKQTFIGGFKYVYIYGHMDQYLAWNNLSLMQQLNCVCDTLAKRALMAAIISGYNDRPTQLLPREDVALVIWGNKVTGNISTPLRFHASKELARSYLRTRIRDKWTNERF